MHLPGPDRHGSRAKRRHTPRNHFRDNAGSNSATHRETLGKENYRPPHRALQCFQLDATACPGNSGSPLYQPDIGQVVGIINKVFIQESKETIIQKPSGISYAIPVNHCKSY
jgi:S1-C subfamily serine protease